MKTNTIMKRNLIFTLLLFFSITAWSQENRVIISYGYEWANVTDFDDPATGWRINGVYEFNQMDGKFAHGLNFAYTSVSATKTVQGTEVKSTVSSIPLYYAPKFIIGSGKVKPFIKGALGTQWAKLKREGAGELTANSFGFYGGGGGGLEIGLSEKLFINAEYEIAYVSNTYYEGGGWLQSAMFGLGFKF